MAFLVGAHLSGNKELIGRGEMVCVLCVSESLTLRSAAGVLSCVSCRRLTDNNTTHYSEIIQASLISRSDLPQSQHGFHISEDVNHRYGSVAIISAPYLTSVSGSELKASDKHLNVRNKCFCNILTSDLRIRSINIII